MLPFMTAVAVYCLQTQNLLVSRPLNLSGAVMKRFRLSVMILLGYLGVSPVHGAEVIEVAAGQESVLPEGKEADGIRGDFVLRSSSVSAVISQNAPLRRANMSTFYGADGVTPGCLYDLTLAGEKNDQITYFGPAGQRGQVSWVRIVPSTNPTEAAVETVITASKGGGIYRRHEYRVRDGLKGVLVTTTLVNEGNEPVKISSKDEWTKFLRTGEYEGIRWADAVDPADHGGYALGHGWVVDGNHPVPEEVELTPHQSLTWTRLLAVGHSPAEAWSVIKKEKGGDAGQLTVSLKDGATNAPITSASVYQGSGEDCPPAYLDAEGKVVFAAGPGVHELLLKDLGRVDKMVRVDVPAKGAVTVSETWAPPSRLHFQITGEQGRSLPCKAQILGIDGTPPVDLGPAVRAHGCKDQYHSERGDFSVQVPAGHYHIVVTHGIEFNHYEGNIDLAQGQEVEIKSTLKRIVDTTGWISADFHNHSTQSGDNVCGTPDRLINIAAEQIEFAPTTEHNRFFDWRPLIEKLGLQDEIQTVTGVELTGSAAHLNCFPITPVPYQQDNGAPVWNADPRIAALTLRGWQGERPDRWIQINHPDLAFLFNDRGAKGVADGGYTGIASMVDGMETQNFVGDDILADAPWRLSRPKGALATKVDYIREFMWLQLLNLGYRIIPVAVADAHSVHGNGVGGWRMYLPSKTDDPAKIDWTGDLAAQAKAGHVILTTGPFLQVATADGHGPGDEIRVTNGEVMLHVKVQCTDWQDIDRVQVLVNGRKDPTLNFTRKSHPQMFGDGVVKFDQSLHISLHTDAHLIVVALSESMTLKTGYGTSDQATLHPMAYHAPLYIDTTGHGFKANGDTLGYDLPVSHMTPDIVRQKLGLPAAAEEKGK